MASNVKYIEMLMNSSKKYQKALNLAKEENCDLSQVFQLLLEADGEGDCMATYAIATWYIHGKYVAKDIKKGFQLLQKSSLNDIPEACYDIAFAYERGEGTSVNLKKAFLNYLKASLLGDDQSVFEVGRCYAYGIGVEKDEDIASIWFNRAIKLGVYEEDEQV